MRVNSLLVWNFGRILFKSSLCEKPRFSVWFYPCAVNGIFRPINRYTHQACEKIPFTMKITSTCFQSIITNDVKFLHNMFVKNGYDIKIAGGAVRDLILGNIPKDLDFATTATPEEMREMFNKNEIRMINLKGESHGTITARINENNFEITTLRIDKVTNGRHALVEFTKNWYLDASRRDLTINAMFLDFDGTVYDYFNGFEDLKNNRVVFVGDASKRIQEDYLRILRYFRFYGRIAKTEDNHDEETLTAIRENAVGLSQISGERIQMELFKIISGNFGPELLKRIISLDIGQYIGLPANSNIDELVRVCERVKTNNFDVEPVTILCSLFNSEADVTVFTARIKPSAYHRDLAYFIVENRSKGTRESLKYYQKLQVFSRKPEFTKSAVKEYLKYIGDVDVLREFENWKKPPFPVHGHEVAQKGVEVRRHIGLVMNELKCIWIESNYTLSKEQLIQLIPEAIAKCDSRKLVKSANKSIQ